MYFWQPDKQVSVNSPLAEFSFTRITQCSYLLKIVYYNYFSPSHRKEIMFVKNY